MVKNITGQRTATRSPVAKVRRTGVRVLSRSTSSRPVPKLTTHIPIDRSIHDLPGIDLRLDEQRALFKILAGHYAEQPFSEMRSPDGTRYYFDNDQYSYADGLFLYGMLRHLRPARLVEIGAGFSSALVLDVTERFDIGTSCTFVEPHPNRYLSLVRPGDERRADLRVQNLQDVNPSLFAELSSGDILFIDSSHVDAPGSDVRKILTDVLGSLAAGVYVHFHDMFWPFEYPDAWRAPGISWNECPAVRSFLANGAPFEIVIWNELLHRSDPDLIAELMPLAARNPGGALWLRKI